MFKATSSVKEIIDIDNSFTVDRWCEVETSTGFICASKVKIGTILKVSDNDDKKIDIIVTKVVELVDKNQIVYYYNIKQ